MTNEKLELMENLKNMMEAMNYVPPKDCSKVLSWIYKLEIKKLTRLVADVETLYLATEAVMKANGVLSYFLIDKDGQHLSDIVGDEITSRTESIVKKYGYKHDLYD